MTGKCRFSKPASVQPGSAPWQRPSSQTASGSRSCASVPGSTMAALRQRVLICGSPPAPPSAGKPSGMPRLSTRPRKRTPASRLKRRSLSSQPLCSPTRLFQASCDHRRRTGTAWRCSSSPCTTSKAGESSSCRRPPCVHCTSTAAWSPTAKPAPKAKGREKLHGPSSARMPPTACDAHCCVKLSSAPGTGTSAWPRTQRRPACSRASPGATSVSLSTDVVKV
mmetsp:Transcript_56206/g.180424  ORF Transcript_56206/g.180424 Transcript_56206/m.180424 type:complete len:223 (-) Transcript_56206:177-845(-)